MDFRKSVLISAAFHLILLFLIPGIRLDEDKLEWAEVSFLTFPDLKEREPDMVSGDPGAPEPSAPLPSPEKSPTPLDLPEVDTGVSSEVSEAAAPETEIERRDTFISREVERARPGRPDRIGVLDNPGDDPGEVITGPVARRNILRKATPLYPAWAEETGIEGEVRLRFWVTPEGSVSRVVLESTSGYPDFDSRAMEAVKKYLFSPIPSDENPEEQWGRITVKYRL